MHCYVYFVVTLDPINPTYREESLLLTCRFNFIIGQNDALMWKMNGTTLANINVQIQLIRRDKKGIMIIPKVSVGLNNTVVQCTARTIDHIHVESNEERLYVEGSFLY